MEEQQALYVELVKLFTYSLNQFRLYAGNHPTTQLAVRSFHETVTQLLQSGNLTVGFMDNRVIVNDEVLDNKRTGVALLLRECQRLQIETLIFNQGTETEEIASLFKVMTAPSKLLEDLGGIKAALEKAGLRHVQLGTTRYQMVKEEEEVVAKSLADQIYKVERIEDLTRYCSARLEGKPEFDIERVSYELENKPAAVAKLMVQESGSAPALEGATQVMVQFLQERCAPVWLQQGKDFSEPIARLAEEFKTALADSGVAPDLKEASKQVTASLEQCSDAVKLDLLIKVFQDTGNDPRTLPMLRAKFLRRREARERLLGPLRERLRALGVAEADLEALVSRPDRRAAGAQEVRISSEALQELFRLRDRFEEEVKKRLVREAAAITIEKERLDNIIRSLAEGLVVVDSDGVVQLMNPAAERLLGVQQGEGRGVPITQSLKTDHIVALAKGPLSAEGENVTKEIEVKSINDESRRVLQASSAIIENEVGKTVGMVAVLSDITKQKRLDEMKSSFVAHVSHELRTPLMAIEGSLSMVLNQECGTISPDQEKFLGIAHQNITRLSRLINDLLDMAKLEAGKLELRPVSFAVQDMVHHVVETVRSWSESKSRNIEEIYPPKPVELEGDPDRLTQVVTNLLGNAVKFTPEGGSIRVAVDPDWQAPDISNEPCVAVSVQDTGIGVALEDQKKIFEKFEQGNRPAHRGIPSTGLGLTIAREIVELHRGKIWVESREGEGSRFTFVIPRRWRPAERSGEGSPSNDPAA